MNTATTSFVLYGEPVAKGRARVTVNKKTGRAFAYTPSATAIAEDRIRSMVLKLRPFQRDVPLAIEITTVKTKPKSVKHKYPTTRPDWDNYAKLVCDAIQKFAYEDDAQIVDVFYRKRYGSPPRTEVSIRAKHEDED